MKTLLNYAEREFHFSQGGGRENMVVIPRATGQGTDKKPGRLNVEDDQLKTMREHHVMRGWFGNDGLQVAEEVDAEAKKAPKPPKNGKGGEAKGGEGGGAGQQGGAQGQQPAK